MKAARLHLILCLAWAALLVPTVLWWRESILWVSLMSVYAIIASHWASYQAAHAEERLVRKLKEEHRGRTTSGMGP